MSLINFFDNRRFWGNKRNKFLSKIRFYSICNKIIEICANTILPIYFNLTKNDPRYTIKESKDNASEKLILSLTSFKTRIPKLWLVVESILRNKIKPDKFILYLQLDSMDDVPKKLQKMQERGVEIRLCSTELRSHNKYFHAMKEFPNDCIITIDDDIFYRNDLIETFVELHKQYPDAIITNRAKTIKTSTPFYKEWPDAETKTIDVKLLPIGVAGVLYPPQSLHEEVFNKRLIKELCLTADDIWLTCMALLKKTPKLFSDYRQGFISVRIPKNTTLLDVNCTRNQICIDNLNNHYGKIIEKRPFIDF